MSLSKWFWDLLKPVERVHPYYEKALPEAETFLSGKMIARNWKKLNSIAETNALQEFSTLEFSPVPLKKESLMWNKAETGIYVIQDQLKIVRMFGADLDGAELLETELERIMLALRIAEYKKVRFTLVRSFGDYTNALMWEAGGGSV